MYLWPPHTLLFNGREQMVKVKVKGKRKEQKLNYKIYGEIN